jgi:hypothetical protein
MQAQRENCRMSETARYGSQGFVHLPGLFPEEVLLALYGQMTRDLAAQGRPLEKSMAQGPLLTKPAIEVYAYQYAPMLTFLWGMTPRIADVVGCDLLPTYAYFRAYQKGDICRVHSDRPACEHSLSLTMIYSDSRPWPLSVATDHLESPKPVIDDDFGDDRFASVPMNAGDGVLYQGTHRRHGRTTPNPNAWSAHLFLHWVEKNGRYKDQAFDRPAIQASNAAR